MENLIIERIDNTAFPPRYMSETCAGIDLFLSQEWTLPEFSLTQISLDIKVNI